jgi:predicted Zn-dependent protease
MKNLHRNPEGQLEMLESMRRIARYRSDKPPQYLLTHPNPEERLNSIESLVENDRKNSKLTPITTDDFEFVRFKYRILAKVKDSRDFKMYLASIIADSRSSAFKKVMADYGLSQIAANENDNPKSLALLEKVIAYFPNKNILKTDKGVVLFAAGQSAEAEKTLREALAVNGSDMYATFTLARLLYRTNRSAEAEKYFQAVSYELPEYAKVYFELGQIAADQQQSGDSSFYLGKYYLYEGKLKEAEHNIKNALRSKTMSENRTEQSKDLLKKIVKLQE